MAPVVRRLRRSNTRGCSSRSAPASSMSCSSRCAAPTREPPAPAPAPRASASGSDCRFRVRGSARTTLASVLRRRGSARRRPPMGLARSPPQSTLSTPALRRVTPSVPPEAAETGLPSRCSEAPRRPPRRTRTLPWSPQVLAVACRPSDSPGPALRTAHARRRGATPASRLSTTIHERRARLTSSRFSVKARCSEQSLDEGDSQLPRRQRPARGHPR